MKKYIKTFTLLAIATTGILLGCKKTEYSFGEIKTPSNFVATATVIGYSVALPNGDSTGRVSIKATANNALSFNVDFGDGKTATMPYGDTTYKYDNAGEYNITVTAVGTGGSVSTITQKISVFVKHIIPPAIFNALTKNGTSQVWITDNDAVGHFGVGPSFEFSPIWYAAPPNTRDACAYDDEITFAKIGDNKISISVDNKGKTFIIAAATASYNLAGGDNCYTLTTAPKVLAFSDAASGSTAANSTKEQFFVPGNGIVNFGTGGATYEILSITANTMTIRNIGADGNAWFQKLKVKP